MAPRTPAGDDQARGRLAALVAEHTAKAVHAVREKLAPVEQAHRVAATRGMLDQFEQELRPTTALIMEAMTAVDPASLPEPVRHILAIAQEPEHAAQSSILVSIAFVFLFQIAGGLVPPMVQDAVNDQWHRFQSVPLSPAEAALAVIKNTMSKGDAQHEASLSGLSPDRFGTMVDNTGEPPGLQQLQEAFRRGFIDEARFAKGVHQGRVRDEWLDVLDQLRVGPPSAEVAIRAAVQNQLPDAQASQIVAENGIDPANYPWLRATYGRPPGIEQMLHAWNHGFVGQADVEQAIRESDVKDKYIPALLALRQQFMPQRTVVSAVHQGVKDAGWAAAYLQRIGYSAEDAAILASEGSATKTAGAKNLSQAIIVKGYREQVIDRGTAASDLAALGYDAGEAAFILDVADADEAAAIMDHAVGAIRHAYVTRRATAAQAGVDLDTVGMPAAGRDRLLRAWDVERGVATKELTLAELSWAVHNNVITTADYTARLLGQGYDQADVTILVAHHAPAAAGP